MSAKLFKTLKPWTGSKAQVNALTAGAVAKKKDNPVYNIGWQVNIAAGGDGLQMPKALPQDKGNFTFFMNFQPYFTNFDVQMDEEFYAFDYGDAIAQMFVYLTTATAGAAFVKGLPEFLGKLWANMVKVVTELAKGNFQAACMALIEVQGSTEKVHGQHAAGVKVRGK